MTNEFFNPDLTPKSASPYASSAYQTGLTIGAPPSGPSSIANLSLPGAGDGVEALTPEKRLLNIINSKLGTAYENIDDKTKEKIKNEIEKLPESETNDAIKKLVADYFATEDEAAKTKALDTFENKYNKPVNGIPSIPAMPDFSAAAAGTPGASLPGTPQFQYPTMGAGGMGGADPFSSIAQGIQGIGNLSNQNGSQAAGADGKPSASANIPVGYADKLKEAKTAEDIKWGTPQTVTGITKDTAAKANEPIDAVSGNFNPEDGSYVLNSTDQKENIAQIEKDQANINTAIDATNADAKNTYLSDGDKAAKELFKNGKATTDEVHGSPDGGSPQEVIKGAKGKIPEAQKAAYLDVKKTYGLEEDDAANRGEVTDKYVKEKTTVSDVDKVIDNKYGKEADNVGVLQGKLDYLAGVEQGAQGDYTKFQGEMTRAETAKNAAILEGRAAAASGNSYSVENCKLRVEAAQADIDKAKEKMKDREAVLKEAQTKKQEIENKLQASAKARTEQVSAIKSGTNSEVAKAIKAKQTDADAVNTAVNAVVGKIQSGVTAGKENEAATFAEMVAPSNANLFKDAKNIVDKFNGAVKTLNDNNKEKVAQLAKTKENLGKILAALTDKNDDKGKGVKIEADGNTGKQKVTVTTDGKENGEKYSFNLDGAKAEVPQKEQTVQAKVSSQALTRFASSTGTGSETGHIISLKDHESPDPFKRLKGF